MPERFRAVKEYRSPYPNPIRFAEGEEVTVGSVFDDEPAWPDWIWVENRNGKSAWAPRQYLTVSGSAGWFIRCYDARELSVQTGEVVVIDEVVNGFGAAVNANGEKGWVPLNYLEPAADEQE